jgi:gliding motility-associated lipoprotein GldH
VIKLKIKNSRLTKFTLLLVIPFFWACGNEVLVDQSLEFETKNWDVATPFSTQFEVIDTVSNFNFFVTLRNTDEYPYQNMFVFLKTTFPNGKSKLDTINCPLADAKGKWMGKGFSGVYDNRVLYMARKRFPLAGKYQINIEQAMRDETLPGILDVGIRIEKAQ